MRKMRKKNNPLVSVIMPVYNAESFLREAIDSILKQTYKNFELIIIDDASTDSSWSIIKKYKRVYKKRVRAFRLKTRLNKGGDACANLAIKKAKGKYIARMDADDIAHPRRLEKQVKFLEKNPYIFLVGSNAYVIDEKGKVIGKKLEPESQRKIYKAYFTLHPIIHSSCMLRKVYQKKKFSYIIKYSSNNDYYTFFKLICQGHRFANLKEKLLYYRIHGKNCTFTNIRKNFTNTLKIRAWMFFNQGYEPSLKQLAINLTQIGAMFLPEKVLTSLYLLNKGIVKPRLAIRKLPLKIKSQPLFLRRLNLLR